MELTAKKKAKELVDKFMFSSIYFTCGTDGAKLNAKTCALRAQTNLLDKLKSLGIKDEFEENIFSEINNL